MIRTFVVRSAALSALLVAAPLALRAQGTPSDTAKPVKVVTPNLDFSGWVFGSFSMQTDSAAKAANGGKAPNKFDVGRAYLTFKMPAGDRASVRVTTDIRQGQSAAGAYQGWFARLKYAYLQYDYLKKTPTGASAFARIGALHTVVIDHEENFWPRYLDKTPIEHFGFFSSADIGLATGITLPNKLGEVYATITNGNGYENPEADRFKDYAARLSITPLAKTPGLLSTFTISPWVYRGNAASKFAVTDSVTDGLARNRWGVFVGNKDRRLSFGADYAERTDGNETGTDVASRVVTDVTGQLFDVFAVVRPLEFSNPSLKSSFGLVGRFDHFKPNKDVDGYTRFIVAGIFWEPTPKTSFALDYQESKPQNGLGGAESKTWFLHWQAYF